MANGSCDPPHVVQRRSEASVRFGETRVEASHGPPRVDRRMDGDGFDWGRTTDGSWDAA